MGKNCSDCVYYKNEIEEYPCIDCRNKCHFRRKGATMIDYNMITNASLAAAMNNIPKRYNKFNRLPDIKNVIFNDPATIVFWSDGSKTVVKVQDGDDYDEEKGLAMAISKKALGNKGNYCNEFKKWLPEEKEDDLESCFTIGKLGKVISTSLGSRGLNIKATIDEMHSVDKKEK